MKFSECPPHTQKEEYYTHKHNAGKKKHCNVIYEFIGCTREKGISKVVR